MLLKVPNSLEWIYIYKILLRVDRKCIIFWLLKVNVYFIIYIEVKSSAKRFMCMRTNKGLNCDAKVDIKQCLAKHGSFVCKTISFSLMILSKS